MILERLLGDLPLRRFLDEYYHRQPFSLPGRADAVASLGTWEVVNALLTDSQADVMVVKEGRRHPCGARPTVPEYHELFADGCTLLVRHAERRHAGLAELARWFEHDLNAAINVHVYCTPGGQFGFGWHYDAEDVFLLQTLGGKEYSLRKNTVNPWPLEEALPRDMQYEREVMPLMQCLLEAGDWLYIPHGFWHRARAQADSITLAVGSLAPASIDVFDHLRERLLASPLWRQRLPVVSRAAPLTAETLARYRDVFAQLAGDLAASLDDDAVLRTWLRTRGVEIDERDGNVGS